MCSPELGLWYLSLSPPPLSPSTACNESGRVFVFGRNKYGELGLGHGSSQSVAVPTPIHSLSGIVKVACGLYHSAAIDGEPTHYVATCVFVSRCAEEGCGLGVS